jgi:hypothetical protein
MGRPKIYDDESERYKVYADRVKARKVAAAETMQVVSADLDAMVAQLKAWRRQFNDRLTGAELDSIDQWAGTLTVKVGTLRRSAASIRPRQEGKK